MVLTHLLYFYEQISIHNPNHSSHVMMNENENMGYKFHIPTKEKEENERDGESWRLFDGLIFPLVKKCMYMQERGPQSVAYVSQWSV
jgi:hypothetical protein